MNKSEVLKFHVGTMYCLLLGPISSHMKITVGLVALMSHQPLVRGWCIMNCYNSIETPPLYLTNYIIPQVVWQGLECCKMAK